MPEAIFITDSPERCMGSISKTDSSRMFLTGSRQAQSRTAQSLSLGLLVVILVTLFGCATTPPKPTSQDARKAEELNREALQHYSVGEFQKALRIWDAAVAKAPDSPKMLYNLGIAHFALQDYDKSVQAFSRSLEYEQNSVPALINRALALSQLGQLEEASQDLKRAARIAPDNPLLLFNLGVLAARQNHFRQAIEHYSAALEQEPGMAQAWNNRGIAHLETKQVEKAASDFTRALRIQDAEASYYFNRALAWEARDRFDEAFSDYTKAINLEPDLAPAYHNRGLLRIHLNRKEGGCRDLEQACELGMCQQLRLLQDQGVCSPEDEDQSLSQVREGQRRDEAPVSELRAAPDQPQPSSSRPQPQKNHHEKSSSGSLSGNGSGDGHPEASKESPRNPEKLYAAALHNILEKKRYTLAREQLEEFITLFPKHSLVPNAYYWLGEIHYVQKDDRQAISIFEIVVRRFPDHAKTPDSLLKTGLAYLNLQEQSKARAILEQLASEYPSSHSAELARQRLRALP